MKIFVEMSYLKNEDYEQLSNRFKHIEFTNVVEQSYDAEIIISMPGYLSNQNLERYPNLKFIMLLTAGFDTLDLGYIRKRNILLANAKDVFSIQIAEDIFAKILFINRNYAKYQEQMKDGMWKHHPVTHEICESTVGIIGTGSIGLEVAKRMKAFGARTLGYRFKQQVTPYIDQLYTTKEGLNQLYQESDYIVVSLPLDEKTTHFIDKQAFSMMKEDVLFINVARGKIVDQEALVDALIQKKIRGACLDVTTPEPLPSDHILWKLPHVIITPHNASASPHVRNRLIGVVISTLDHYFQGNQLENQV